MPGFGGCPGGNAGGRRNAAAGGVRVEGRAGRQAGAEPAGQARRGNGLPGGPGNPGRLRGRLVSEGVQRQDDWARRAVRYVAGEGRCRVFRDDGQSLGRRRYEPSRDEFRRERRARHRNIRTARASAARAPPLQKDALVRRLPRRRGARPCRLGGGPHRHHQAGGAGDRGRRVRAHAGSARIAAVAGRGSRRRADDHGDGRGAAQAGVRR